MYNPIYLKIYFYLLMKTPGKICVKKGKLRRRGGEGVEEEGKSFPRIYTEGLIMVFFHGWRKWWIFFILFFLPVFVFYFSVQVHTSCPCKKKKIVFKIQKRKKLTFKWKGNFSVASIYNEKYLKKKKKTREKKNPCSFTWETRPSEAHLQEASLTSGFSLKPD